MINTYKEIVCDENILKKTRFLEIAANSTRILILCFMYKYKEACVTDIAKSLNMSVASISHHLQIMRDNGFFKTKRMGNNICYQLINNESIKYLKKIICDCK